MAIITGTPSDDFLPGTPEPDTITGDAGNDTIAGGDGDDTITGDDGDDFIRGQGGADTISGGAGSDTLFGGSTSSPSPQPGDLGDTIDGGDGNDLIRGGDGDDILRGGTGDDNLRGDAGNDTMDGGDGFDFISYRYDDLVGPVSIDMTAFTGTGSVNDGRGGTDTVSNFEFLGLLGTAAADTLLGSTALRNQIFGGDGNDIIAGGTQDDNLYGDGGDDTITGGDGNDMIGGGLGADTINGGAGIDTIDYSGSSAGISINLQNGRGRLGDAEGDRLTSIENAIGSALADTFVGSNGSNRIDGGDGNDSITGGGGADELLGGLGSDSFLFRSTADFGSLAGWDRVLDFDAGGNGTGGVDLFDFSAIDANTRSAGRNDAFNFIGTGGFTGRAGELRVVYTSATEAIIMGDVNGDGVADFNLNVTYTGTIDTTDFIL